MSQPILAGPEPPGRVGPRRRSRLRRCPERSARFTRVRRRFCARSVVLGRAGSRVERYDHGGLRHPPRGCIALGAVMRRIGRLLILLAVLLPAGVIASAAANGDGGVGAAVLACDSFNGDFTVAPGIRNIPSSHTVQATGNVFGCRKSGGGAVFTATLHMAHGSCAFLAMSGNATVQVAERQDHVRHDHLRSEAGRARQVRGRRARRERLVPRPVHLFRSPAHPGRVGERFVHGRESADAHPLHERQQPAVVAAEPAEHDVDPAPHQHVD